MVQRYMTTETEKQAQKSVLTNAILTIPATLLFFFVGTVLYVYYLKSATTRLYDTEAKIICIVSKKGAQCIECHHKDI